MNRNSTKIITGVWLLLIMVLAHAGISMWTFSPRGPTQVPVPANSTATVQYKITNQSPKTHELVMRPIVGIKQDTTGGNCPNPFVLGYGKSCYLTLAINGKALTGDVIGGPVVCSKGSHNQCYQPTFAQSLRIIKGPAVRYTVGGTVSGLSNGPLVLQNNGIDDLIINEDGSFTFRIPIPIGGSYNVTVKKQPIGQTCTVVNSSGTNIKAKVTNISVICSINTFTISGTVSGLTTNGLVLQNNSTDNLSVPANATSFQFLTPVAYGSGYNVTVLHQPPGQTCTVNHSSGANITANITNVVVSCRDILAYVTNSNTVSRCAVDNATGAFNNCSDTGGTTFNRPQGIVFNAKGTIVFVANTNSSTVSRCDVDSATGLFSNCSATSGNFVNPVDIVLSPTGARAFVTNRTPSYVSRCDVDSTTGALSNCTDTGGSTFSRPLGMTLNAAGTRAFVANALSNSVSRCDVDSLTGAFSNCSNTGGTLFSAPLDVVLDSTGTRAFVNNGGTNSVTSCDVDGATGAFTNCADTGATGISPDFAITLNAAGDHAFVTNKSLNTVTQCDVDVATGSFSNCADTGGGPFIFPEGIVLH